MRIAITALLLLASALVSGCLSVGPTIQTNGTDVSDKYWEVAKGQIAPRASFDLQCPVEQLDFQLVRTNVDKLPIEVGVAGCQRRGLYITSYNRFRSMYEDGRWVLNGSD